MEIDSKDFSRLLESHGFKVLDMTEINGLTYFRTQNHRGQSYNILYGFAVLFRGKVKIVDIMFIKESEFRLFTNSYVVFLS